MQQIFSEYPCLPGMVLGPGETATNKIDKITGSHRVYMQEERQYTTEQTKIHSYAHTLHVHTHINSDHGKFCETREPGWCDENFSEEIFELGSDPALIPRFLNYKTELTTFTPRVLLSRITLGNDGVTFTRVSSKWMSG